MSGSFIVADVLVCGLERMGSHAIINWMASNMTNNHVIHFNNIRGEAKDKYQAATELNYHNPDLPACHIYSFERQNPLHIFALAGETKILIVRDIFNWLASWLYSGRALNEGTMKTYERCLDCVKDWVNMPNGKDVNFLPISFNDWFEHSEYREDTAIRLGMPSHDKGLQEVLSIGAGSSFDKTKFDGKAQQMDVLNRWKKFEGDRTYQNYLSEYSRAVKLSIQIFNFNPMDIEC